MSIGTDQLTRLREDVVDSVEHNILMLLVTVEVVQLADIHRQQDGLALRMIFDTHGEVPRRLMAAHLFGRSRTARGKNGKQRIISFVEIVQAEVELPEQQRLQFETLEHRFVCRVERSEEHTSELQSRENLV